MGQFVTNSSFSKIWSTTNVCLRKVAFSWTMMGKSKYAELARNTNFMTTDVTDCLVYQCMSVIMIYMRMHTKTDTYNNWIIILFYKPFCRFQHIISVFVCWSHGDYNEVVNQKSNCKEQVYWWRTTSNDNTISALMHLHSKQAPLIVKGLYMSIAQKMQITANLILA